MRFFFASLQCPLCIYHIEMGSRHMKASPANKKHGRELYRTFLQRTQRTETAQASTPQAIPCPPHQREPLRTRSKDAPVCDLKCPELGPRGPAHNRAAHPLLQAHRRYQPRPLVPDGTSTSCSWTDAQLDAPLIEVNPARVYKE